VVIGIVSIHLLLMRPQKRFFEQKMRESERVARIIEMHLLAEMATGEPDNLQNYIEPLQGQAGIRRIEITDPSMVVRFSSEKTRVGLKINREEESPCRICHVERENVPQNLIYESEGVGRIFAIDHVMYNGPDCRGCHGDEGPILGNILVELSLMENDLEALAVRKKLMATAGILLIVLLFGMGSIIHLLVGRPAADLLVKMNRIEAGDFRMGETRKSKDEFGCLDRGFGNMVEKLRELYTNMEAKIEERTKSLYETQAQVMHQEKLAGIGQLAAGVAHEIGNPLTSIDSLVQLLDIESGDPNVREKVKTIQRQVDRISEIVHNMADLSRPLSSEDKSVDVVTVLHSVLGLVRYDARFRSIEINTDFPRSLPCVKTIEDRLFGVFLNLALNGADAMPDGGRLDISARLAGDEIVVDFRDTGHGIAEDNLGKIFGAYFTTKRPGKGTGLGLTVCRTFLQNLGGDIEVESEVGKGSTFHIRIPVEPNSNREEAV
jgi:signal transduction histidine kinase